MGVSCSKCVEVEHADNEYPISRQNSPDPTMYDLMRRSVAYTGQANKPELFVDRGQYHLLYKHQKLAKLTEPRPQEEASDNKKDHYPTRLIIRRHSLRHYEEGVSGTHIYTMRYPADKPLDVKWKMDVVDGGQEQAPRNRKHISSKPSVQAKRTLDLVEPTGQIWPALKEKKERDEDSIDILFEPLAMAITPKQRVTDWVTISAEHNIFVADVGMTVAQCDEIVRVTEQVCRGQYNAYTYAKQTLGCREFPVLAHVCQSAVHTITHEILEFGGNSNLALDDREPHMVKYDVTKRERQKLDMHTDKSEWTFLISLSNGSGIDYEGGGTYFECIDSTIHVQRGHALVFPGKLRHCGQRITSGLRFLLVGFLVDKSSSKKGPAIMSVSDQDENSDA